MAAPAIPFYGKDSDRLARLAIAYKVLMESESFLKNWPSTVPDHQVYKRNMDTYQAAFEDAAHQDRRAIAARIAACNEAGVTWQKMVNYACSTVEDHSEMLVRMGVLGKSQRTGSSTRGPGELYAPDLTVANQEQKGAIRLSCPRERRRYTYDVWGTDGDPRMEEGWRHLQSFGDGTKMDLNGYTPGKEISLRCRLIGKDNTYGPWSHVVTIMVT